MKAVRVLDEDPELGQHLAPEAVAAARAALVARVLEIPAGRWTPRAADYDAGGHFGLLMLDGMMLRDLTLGTSTTAELLSGGEILRPFEHDGDIAPVPFELGFSVIARTRLAILDRQFACAAARWPEIAAAIIGRSTRRTRWLAIRLAINAITRVDVRLLLLFWQLADRYGRVTPRGVVVHAPLTHQALGRLIGAQRPSVTTALKHLLEERCLERGEGGEWLLIGQPPEELARLDPRLARRGRWADED